MLEKLIAGLYNAINQEQTITLATNQFNSGLFKIGTRNVIPFRFY